MTAYEKGQTIQLPAGQTYNKNALLLDFCSAGVMATGMTSESTATLVSNTHTTY